MTSVFLEGGVFNSGANTSLIAQDFKIYLSKLNLKSLLNLKIQKGLPLYYITIHLMLSKEQSLAQL